MTRSTWTPTETATLRRLYADTPTEAIVEQLPGRTLRQVYSRAYELGLRKSAAYLHRSYSGRIKKSGQHPNMIAARFQPGLVPWNKGMKGLDLGGKATQFKPGSLPHNTLPVGSYRYHWRDGTLEVKVSEERGYNRRRWRQVARVVWEAAHGPVPAKHVVAFKPGMKTAVLEEITLARIECISMAENAMRNHPRSKHPELGRLVQLKGAITRQVNRITREAKERNE